MSIFRKKKPILEELLDNLSKITEEHNCVFCKVYYKDRENYTIKLIDENENLVKSYRKTKDKKYRAFDLKKSVDK